MYINVLPFAHARAAGTWRELVRSVFDREVELWPHRRYPLPAVARLADAGSRPIDVVFGYVETRQDGGAAVEASGTDLVEVGGPGATEFGLSVGAGGGTVRLVSDGRTADPTALVRIGAMFREVLSAMVTDPGGDAAALRLPAGERGRPRPVHPGPDRRGRRVRAGGVRGAGGAAAGRGGGHGRGRVVLVRAVERPGEPVGASPAGAGGGAGGPGRGVCAPVGRSRSWRCWRCTRRVGCTCRWIRRTRRSGWRSCWPTRRPRCCSPPPSCGRNCRRSTATVVLLDEPDAWAGQPPTDPEPLTDPDNGSVVIYTSGSTGRPKGSLMSHRALVNRTEHVGAQVYRLDRRRRRAPEDRDRLRRLPGRGLRGPVGGRPDRGGPPRRAPRPRVPARADGPRGRHHRPLRAVDAAGAAGRGAGRVPVAAVGGGGRRGDRASTWRGRSWPRCPAASCTTRTARPRPPST